MTDTHWQDVLRLQNEVAQAVAQKFQVAVLVDEICHWFLGAEVHTDAATCRISLQFTGKQKMNKIRMILAAFCCVALNAWAAPGYEITSFAIQPMQGPAFTAAMEEWMASDAAKKYKGRVYLQSHDNDGANPATHSIVAVYPSMAEQEAYSTWVGENEEALASWMTLIEKTSAISTVTSTARLTRVASWGDISDKDRVWIQHSLTTRDGATLYRTLDAWMNSEAAKNFPGQMHLGQVIAAGIGAGSHGVVIGFESFAEMESWNEAVGGSAGLTQLFHTFSVINDYHGASLVVDVNAWGKSLKSVLK